MATLKVLASAEVRYLPSPSMFDLDDACGSIVAHHVAERAERRTATPSEEVYDRSDIQAAARHGDGLEARRLAGVVRPDKNAHR